MRRLTCWLALIATVVGFGSRADADLPFFRFLDRDERAESRRERTSRQRDAERRDRTMARSTPERAVIQVEGPRLLPELDRDFRGPVVQIPPAPLDERGLPPVPGPYLGEPLPVPMHPEYSVVPEQLPLLPEMAGPLASGPLEVYRRVKYDDRDDAHPHGIKQLVAVRDPRACRKACDCCGARLVLVEVCVPPRGCPKVKIGKDARKVELDYGEYEIEVEVDDDEIEVEYED